MARKERGERERYHAHRDGEEMNWLFLEQLVGHWDDAGKLRVDRRGWK
jgi:hypothetical protein